MSLHKDKLKKLTSLTAKEIVLCLLKKELIVLDNTQYTHFYFHDKKMNDLYLLQSKKRTLWKNEAEEYLLNICQECRKLLAIKMKTSFVRTADLPFIREQEYHISVEKTTTKTMLFNSSLGKFLSFKIGHRSKIKEGK